MVLTVAALAVLAAAPLKQFDITKFGAQPDGQTLCTGALMEAVSTAAKAAPAEVFVPAGRFLTGAFGLASGGEASVGRRGRPTRAYEAGRLPRYWLAQPDAGPELGSSAGQTGV